MSLGVHVVDPVDDHLVWFVNGDDPAGAAVYAQLHLDVATRHHVTILEVYRMLRVAVFGPDALDDKFNPFAELKRLQDQAERDHALVKRSGAPLPIEELVAIWERAHDAVLWSAEHHPNAATRARLAAFLAEQEASMERLVEKARELSAKQKIRVVK